MKINFDRAIADLRRLREIKLQYARTAEAEYAYQLISLLMESQKLLNDEFFAVDYIDEKTNTLEHLRKWALEEDMEGRKHFRDLEHLCEDCNDKEDLK